MATVSTADVLRPRHRTYIFVTKYYIARGILLLLGFPHQPEAKSRER
jgi:hypothetical protein